MPPGRAPTAGSRECSIAPALAAPVVVPSRGPIRRSLAEAQGDEIGFAEHEAQADGLAGQPRQRPVVAPAHRFFDPVAEAWLRPMHAVAV